jgi:hypothetical protein
MFRFNFRQEQHQFAAALSNAITFTASARPSSSRIWRSSVARSFAESAETVTENSSPIFSSEPERSFGSIFVPRFNYDHSSICTNKRFLERSLQLDVHDLSITTEIAYGVRDDGAAVILVGYDDGHVDAFVKLRSTGWIKAVKVQELDKTRPLDKAAFELMFPLISPLLVPPRG